MQSGRANKGSHMQEKQICSALHLSPTCPSTPKHWFDMEKATVAGGKRAIERYLRGDRILVPDVEHAHGMNSRLHRQELVRAHTFTRKCTHMRTCMHV